MVRSNLYKEAVNVFGIDNQKMVTIGELAECSAELSKTFISNREPDEQAILNELADVCIMMEQMKVIYGEALVGAIHCKLKKVKGHIDDELQRRNS